MDIEALLEKAQELNGGELSDDMLATISMTGKIPEGFGEDKKDDIDVGSSPTDEEKEEEVNEEEPEESDEEAKEDSVILAKDGKNTIPFSELTDARNALKEANGTIAVLQAKLQEVDGLKEKIQAAQEKDAETGNDDEITDLFDGLSEDYPEAAKMLAKLQKQLSVIEEERLARKQEQEELDARTEAQKKFDDAAVAIEKRYLEATNSDEFWNWIDNQPLYVQSAKQSPDPKVAAALVSAFYDSQKSAETGDTGKKNEAVEKASKDKVVKAIKEAKEQSAIESLSDVPGGTNPEHDEANAIANMDGLSLFKSIQGKSIAEVEKKLARFI